MVSDQTRSELWNQLLDINHNCRYYEALRSKAVRRHFTVRIVTLVALAGSITAVLNLLPWGNDLVKTLIVALVTGLTIWDAVSNYSKRAAVAHFVHSQSVKIRSEMNDLWLMAGDGSIEDDDMRQRMLELSRSFGEVENWVGMSDIETDVKLNRKTTKEADEDVADRYRQIDGTA